MFLLCKKLFSIVKGETMSDTIFYKGKLKKSKKPIDVFLKIQKSIKKKGPTKNWICQIDEGNQCLIIDFCDGKSENFILKFSELEFSGFCKVDFALDGELFEDGKSEFKSLLDCLYHAHNCFSKIEITDDYNLAEDYWSSKRFLIVLRDLSNEEKMRLDSLFNSGISNYEDFVLEVIANDMNISVKDLEENINPKTVYSNYLDEKKFDAILETYLYETMTYLDQGRLCDMPEDEYIQLSGMSMSIVAFISGVTSLYFRKSVEIREAIFKRKPFGAKDAQIKLFFLEKIYPLLNHLSNEYERCMLVYRYFLSILDYSGFSFVGKK